MRRITANEPISIDDLRGLVPGRFRDFVKGVVDVSRGILLIDADMHSDQEAALLADGSAQRDLWGINLYPQLTGPDWIEFDSMINLRPSFGNRSRGVDDTATQEMIRSLIESLVRR
jgi:hypothetical protein